MFPRHVDLVDVGISQNTRKKGMHTLWNACQKGSSALSEPNMINMQSETILTLSEAANRLPKRRRGKRPHVATMYRWARNGLRGTRLEVKGVQIDDRKLNKCANGLAMSVSTRQLPFAGYNDPRRLLLAAKMQAQAIDLYQAEEPIVRSSSAESDDPPPPGANLLVGYPGL